MEIMKQNVDGQELARINALTRRELTEDEVYCFAVRLCDNEIDRDFERFDDGALEELGKRFVGVPGLFDHKWSAEGQTARIYRTEVIREAGLTADGRPLCWLKGWAYMVRTGENAALIAEIDGGIKREVSVGCAVETVLCSLCGQELGVCAHVKGEEYDGRLCHGVLTNPTDVYEWSFVAVPAQRRAGVVKQAGGGAGQEAALGRRYLKNLRREAVRLACIAHPGMDREMALRVAGRLDEEELQGMIKLYRAQTDALLRPAVQLSYGAEMPEEGGDCSAPFLI